ncbi:MAG: PKD domain-containing protein, partial [bacterium]
MMPCYQDREHLYVSTLFRIVIVCLLFVVSFSLVLFLIPRNAHSLDITLAWDANTEPDLAGYRLFYHVDGNDYDYENPDWQGTDTTCTIPGLDETKKIYFVARAYDIYGNESDNSNEVFYSPDIIDNLPPDADAGPAQSVNEGATVTLDGTGSSDPDGIIDGYQWTQIAGTGVALSDAGAIRPTFTAPQVGVSGTSLTFELQVTDNGGLTDTDAVIITVADIAPVNEPPAANAGVDQTVNEGTVVTLDGTNSSDPEGSIAGYQWTQTAGTGVALSDAGAIRPTFTAP